MLFFYITFPGTAISNDAPLLGRDYFWDLLTLSHYALQFADPISFGGSGSSGVHGYYSPFLRAPQAGKGAFAANVRGVEYSRTSDKLIAVAHNSDQPFEEWPLLEMLKSVGWKLYSRNSVYTDNILVPHWNAKSVNQYTFLHEKYVSGVDYFDLTEVEGRDDLIAYLMVSSCLVELYFCQFLVVQFLASTAPNMAPI